MKVLSGIGCIWLISTTAWVLQANDLTSKENQFFESKVRPLLDKHCLECHSAAQEIKGGLRLDTRSGWIDGGDSGDVIIPGNPGGSLLMETVAYANPDLQMPPKYKLNEEEISVIRQWISMGAPDPRTDEDPDLPHSLTEIDIEEGRKHWAFGPVTDPQPPAVIGVEWPKVDLDRFILDRIEKAGISPSPDADRFTLIRRITLDLTGLPPTVDEINAFVRDPRSNDDAITRVVDRLLNSERFGERWGRHWLDLARYADSSGRTLNVPFPFAWRYRNYVIDSFNRDKPYDQFIAEQIAGDLLPARNEAHRIEMLIGSGFLALGSMNLTEGNDELFMLDRIDDQIDTLGRSVLALTLSCARCHDHKFDPVAQQDYYALASIFASTETLSGTRNRGRGESSTATNTYLLASLQGSSFNRLAETNRKIAEARREIDRIKEEMIFTGSSSREGKRLASDLNDIREKLARLEKSLARNQASRSQLKVDPRAPFAMSAREGGVSDLAIRLRGEPSLHGDIVNRGFPRVLYDESDLEMTSIPDDESGRLELAGWLGSPRHPLTSRVMVNRVWSHLIGRGIVPTVDDFGLAGQPPSDPRLLDHLATHFSSGGWSIKNLIRTIMLSRTYRMSSSDIPENSAVDEDNALFWRMNLRRLEAEVIRDSLLAAGGLLDLRRPFRVPAESLSSRELGDRGITGVSERIYGGNERSVYLPVFRSNLPEILTLFDFADPTLANGKRDITTVSPQALFMLNSEVVIDISRRGAERILRINLPDKPARIRYAYAYALCRNPTDAELARADSFIRTREDWAPFVQALFSTAEFRYIR